MSGRTMEERVTVLEKLAESLVTVPGELRTLSDRVSVVEGRLGLVEGRLGSVEGRLGSVESQVVQLRGEMRAEFSAIRGEIATQGQQLRAELATKAELKQDIAALSMEMAGHFLEAERSTRLLFEEFLGKRRAIDEGNPSA